MIENQFGNIIPNDQQKRVLAKDVLNFMFEIINIFVEDLS